jgi:hypothetical protein
MKIPGRLIVFDVTDPSFYRGKLSPDFTTHFRNGECPWFFQPDDWIPNNPDNAWYGSISGSLLERLECYSIGYPTREAAQAAAATWLEALRYRAEADDGTRSLW